MKAFAAAFVITLGLAVPVAAQIESQLGAAKELYASARYDEALTVLNGLRGGDPTDRRSVEQYRSLCLLALGRATEAESAIAAVVTADPTYRPGDDESPRVRSTFTEVRRRLLPELTTARYQAAKAVYDRREWAAAEQQFRIVLGLIDDPDAGGKLGDLRVLTVGFLELSAKAAAPPPPPPPAPEPEPKPAAAAAPVAPLAPAVEPGRVYVLDETGVTAPLVIRQDIPQVPAPLIAMARPRGLLEIVIDDLGRVVSMTMRGSIHPTYDSQVLAAARDWKYQPATLNGTPVKFRKLIQIAVRR